MQDVESLKLSVGGLEATQAVQTFKVGCDADTSEGVEALPLVAGKPLAVRVYPHVLMPPSWRGNVSVDGELWFREMGTDNQTQAFRFPGPVPAQPATSIYRGDACQTLNFYIAGRFARAPLNIRARVWVNLKGPERHCSEWVEKTICFVDTRPLRIHLYGVHFHGQGLDLAAPTVAEAVSTLTFLRKTYPISDIDVVGYEVIDFSGDFTDRRAAECGRGWRELLLLLLRLRTASLSTDPHYALLPTGVPTDGFRGFGTPLGVGASFVGDGIAMAQELGHVFYRRHAPGRGALDVDPCYPAYEGFPSGSIGEYGFDPVTGQVYSPVSSYDFMSYCDDVWVSIYTYRALLEVFRWPSENRTNRRITRGMGDNVYLHLGFCIRGDKDVELISGLTLRGRPIESHHEVTSYRLELRNDRGQVLSTQAIGVDPVHPDSGEQRHFFESIPYQRTARQLVFAESEGNELETYMIPQDELYLELDTSSLGPPRENWEGIAELSWKVTCKIPEHLVFFLRYTCDGGVHWKPVNMGFRWNSCQVNLDHLPGGSNCRFQVIASTILRTAIAETVPFHVRRKPRKATIAKPDAQSPLVGTSPLELIGVAHSPGGFANDHELTWTSNRQGYLGHGTYLLVHVLVPGEHMITLTAPDGLGGETQDQMLVNVVDTTDSFAASKGIQRD